MECLITGVTGQDGSYLAKLLIDKGHEVFGTYRRLSTPNFWRLQYLDIFDRVNLIPVDLIDVASIIEAIRVAEPDEVYHLAAQSFVGTSFEQPLGSQEITGMGVSRILEAIRLINPKIRFYQASTSELYGGDTVGVQNEETIFKPASPYAVAKLQGYWMTRIYRESYGMFACNGLLFNHESPLRGLEFVTRKVSNAVARIYLGLQDKIKLGNLDARRDWGYAPEYCEAMVLMLQQDKPDDYVVATNESHTVGELAKKAFEVVGLEWGKYVEVDKRFMRPLDVRYLQGDYSKAKRILGWEPKVRFDDLVAIMVNADVERWQKWQMGKSFSWDAANYPSENKILSRMMKLER